MRIMPFAPAVLGEDADRYFIGADRAPDAAYKLDAQVGFLLRRVQQRLNVLYASNLEVNGDLDDRTVEWIKRLQSEHRLERTGVPNEATLMQLFYPRNANGD